MKKITLYLSQSLVWVTDPEENFDHLPSVRDSLSPPPPFPHFPPDPSSPAKKSSLEIVICEFIRPDLQLKKYVSAHQLRKYISCLWQHDFRFLDQIFMSCTCRQAASKRLTFQDIFHLITSQPTMFLDISICIQP